jgi:hypothetical protein
MLHGISANPKKDLPKIKFYMSNNLITKHSRSTMHMFDTSYCIHIVMKIAKFLSHMCHDLKIEWEEPHFLEMLVRSLMQGTHLYIPYQHSRMFLSTARKIN